MMNEAKSRLETDMGEWLASDRGGWQPVSDDGFRRGFRYDGNGVPQDNLALDPETLCEFVKATQPVTWSLFEKRCRSDARNKFCRAFQDAVEADGLIHVLQHGFKHRGQEFKVIGFKPETDLNPVSGSRYRSNIAQFVRRCRFSARNPQCIDWLFMVNGIPLAALSLADSVDLAEADWMGKDCREECFQFNRRILVYFAADAREVRISTHLLGADTVFLPFNQGSSGPGADGGAGNPPPGERGYATAYLWEEVLQKDCFLEILQKFISFRREERKLTRSDGARHSEVREEILFPRYHQLDVVRKLIADTRMRGPGHNYLIQHSAGSGKSNSIAWTAYRLASLHDAENRAVFHSVIVISDRKVLDSQLQETIDGFDHTLGSVELIHEKKSARDLLAALQNGRRIIVTTLQKFPVISDLVGETDGKAFAVIVDEAHSGQTGQNAMKLKEALADPSDALEEYAAMEAEAEEERDAEKDRMLKALAAAGKHANLSFYAFTATPRDQTLEIFGEEWPDGSFHPFHVYSMRQAIEEGFILDALANYTTYQTCFRLARDVPENPEVPVRPAMKTIRRYAQLHPRNIQNKAEIAVETFRDVTAPAIGGRGKMMLVASSRLAAVRYYQEINRYIRRQRYEPISVMIAFSGKVSDPLDPETEYSESGMNRDPDGNRIAEGQTKAVFHESGDILIAAEKFQTGFDEPLLHTMIIDKRLSGGKTVQTICRLNRVCPGKNDTFVLDFVNSAEEIRKAFQPFYTQTSLNWEINIDRIYDARRQLRAYGVYTDEDVERVVSIDLEPGNRTKPALLRRKITGALERAAERYNENLDAGQRYGFRRDVRHFVRWYNYITQIVRMFDAALHREYIFCGYLERLLPAENTQNWDLENKVCLEFYRLKETFAGSIALMNDSGGHSAAYGVRKEIPPAEKRTPLDRVIEKFNERYAGEITEGDRILAGVLMNRIRPDETLRKSARQDGQRIFENSTFSKAYDKAALDSYKESQETFAALFSDPTKYAAMKQALAEILYREYMEE